MRKEKRDRGRKEERGKRRKMGRGKERGREGGTREQIITELEISKEIGKMERTGPRQLLEGVLPWSIENLTNSKANQVGTRAVLGQKEGKSTLPLPPFSSLPLSFIHQYLQL